jgi:hypothetical protein
LWIRAKLRSRRSAIAVALFGVLVGGGGKRWSYMGEGEPFSTAGIGRDNDGLFGIEVLADVT